MVDQAYYMMNFECANCGHKFEKQLRKGTPAQGQAGICPNCGVRDNTSGVGGHRVIKANESENPTGGRQVLMENGPYPQR
jgi:DNA-directed RNA polymerase subunit RPC12/RpoP